MHRLIKITFIFMNILIPSILGITIIDESFFGSSILMGAVNSTLIYTLGGFNKERIYRKFEFISSFFLSLIITIILNIVFSLSYGVKVQINNIIYFSIYSIIILPLIVFLLYRWFFLKHKPSNLLIVSDDTIWSRNIINFIGDFSVFNLNTLEYTSHNEIEEALMKYIKTHKIDFIITDKITKDILFISKVYRIQLMTLGKLSEMYLRKIPISLVKKNEQFYTACFQDKQIDPAIRILDLLASLIIAILTLPICILVAILIKLIDRNNIFYEQERVGYMGSNFKILKFSSMIMKKDMSEYVVSKLGNILRKLRINELPQIWNVMKGEMSLVGPRPDLQSEYDFFIDKIPFYQYRLNAIPGITGHAQVYFDYVDIFNVENTEKRLEYDLYYVKNNTIYLYLITILKSIGTVIFMKGK